MSKQIQITLSENTINQINQVIGSKDVSLFVDPAINFYLTKINQENIAQQLKEVKET
jgi:hypothetical protein